MKSKARLYVNGHYLEEFSGSNSDVCSRKVIAAIHLLRGAYHIANVETATFLVDHDGFETITEWRNTEALYGSAETKATTKVRWRG